MTRQTGIRHFNVVSDFKSHVFLGKKDILIREQNKKDDAQLINPYLSTVNFFFGENFRKTA